MAAPGSRILLPYFSRTGRVERVAREIAAELSGRAQVVLAPIQPARERAYWNWLMLSFLPGSSVRLASPHAAPAADFEMVCLGLPKWTVSCPPVNRFLSGDWVAGCRFATFVCYGGFDESRYVRSLHARLSRKGGAVIASALFRRSEVDAGTHGQNLVDFCDAMLGALQGSRQLDPDPANVG